MSQLSVPLTLSGGPPHSPIPPRDLAFDDGVPMDSPWHRAAMTLLIDSIECRWSGRKDFYVGGNMFIHFSEAQVRNQDFRGPDFFCVLDVDHDKPRKYWAIWEEDGRYPDVIIELISPTTANQDRTVKKKVYERSFRTPEYFCFDPDAPQFEGWRLRQQYVAIEPNETGWLWSERLDCWLGTWQGVFEGHEALWPRFFEKDGRMVPTFAENERSRAMAAEAEVERLRAELARLRNNS